jgi:hypothetical protein
VLLASKELSKKKAPAAHCVPGAGRAKSRFLDECLAKFGVDVRYGARAATYVVTDRRLLLTGHYELARATEMQRFGHLMALRGAPVSAYYGKFEAQFAVAKPGPKPEHKARKDLAKLKKPSASCSKMRPAALTFAEMQRMRAAFRTNSCN